MNLNKFLVIRNDAEPVYKVNKENGTVVCIIKVFYGLRNRCNDKQYAMWSAVLDVMNDTFVYRAYTGVARLVEGDTWDEEKGRKIAYIKARRKAMDGFAKWLQKASFRIESLNKALLGEMFRYQDSVEVETKELNKLTK